MNRHVLFLRNFLVQISFNGVNEAAVEKLNCAGLNKKKTLFGKTLSICVQFQRNTFEK